MVPNHSKINKLEYITAIYTWKKRNNSMFKEFSNYNKLGYNVFTKNKAIFNSFLI